MGFFDESEIDTVGVKGIASARGLRRRGRHPWIACPLIGLIERQALLCAAEK